MAEIDVFGIPVPDAGPLFLGALALHVAAGLTCVVCGAAAALSRKGGEHHIRYGRGYFGALAVVFATMSVMSAIRWREDAHLFAVGSLAFAAGLVGYLDRRRRRRGGNRDTRHVVAMGVSYVALLTAFYVDNGPHLPLWQRLPAWAFWVLPGLVGLPIILRATRRNRPEATP